MKDILIATYTREDTYNGHSKINHYHIPTEIRCYVCDNSEERAMGIMVWQRRQDISHDSGG